ncbi:hypothetical protein B6D29_04000 [Microgenomates bacterium UTCPR1]|nr:MAG: hypothetical protein B6D29_04000 [Microgenomates bacterium UTCPR1]
MPKTGIKRNKTIDNLRGIAMVAMMMIHSCSYFLKDRVTFLIWDYLQWAVPIFLFCSFYLALKDTRQTDIVKRLKRLFIPYWIFLFFYFILLYFFEKGSFNFPNFLANLFLYKGIDNNWLVLLFLYFTFITIFFKKILKHRILFSGFFLLSLISSIFLIFNHALPYRPVMWLPWSLILFFTYFVVKNEDSSKNLNLMGIFSFSIFLGNYFLMKSFGINNGQYANKYPPTILHLSYGIASTIFFFRLSDKGFFRKLKIEGWLKFFSINSYSLYFIHIIFLLIIQWSGLNRLLNWPLHFMIVVTVSSVSQILINRFLRGAVIKIG